MWATTLSPLRITASACGFREGTLKKRGKARQAGAGIGDVGTEAALAFHERCGKDHDPACDILAAKFKELGALLYERFELEDCLIEVLHNAHKQNEVEAIQA